MRILTLIIIHYDDDDQPLQFSYLRGCSHITSAAGGGGGGKPKMTRGGRVREKFDKGVGQMMTKADVGGGGGLKTPEIG